jgi:hypothetical protein
MRLLIVFMRSLQMIHIYFYVFFSVCMADAMFLSYATEPLYPISDSITKSVLMQQWVVTTASCDLCVGVV